MKKKQKTDLRSKSASELLPEVDKREKEIAQIKIQIATGKIKNTSSLKVKLDELAVTKTIINEKQLTGEQK